MSLVIQITFNEQITLKQENLRWNLLLKKLNKNIKNLAIASLVLFMLGTVVAFDEGRYFNIYIVGGIVFGFLPTLSFPFNLKTKRIYLRKVQEISRKFALANATIVYEFNDSCLIYQDFEKKLKFKWDAFSNYAIVEDNIFIIKNNAIDTSFIIGKVEVSKEDYESVIQFLKEKLPVKEFD